LAGRHKSSNLRSPSRAATLVTATKSNLSLEATIRGSVARSYEAARGECCRDPHFRNPEIRPA